MNQVRKMSLLFLVIIFVIGGMAGCNSNNSAKKAANEENQEIQEKAKQPEEQTTRKFTDSVGREVEIPANITKIAPSGPLAQMVLYSIAPKKLIGWARKPGEAEAKYFDQKILNLPTFGMFYGDTFNLEALIAAKPDVIIDIGEAKKTVKEDMDEIQKSTGIPTIFVEAKLDTIPQSYQILGDILNEKEQAEALSSYSEAAINDAKEISSSIPEKEIVTLFYGIGDNGLNTNGKGSFHAEIFDFVGVENVAVLDQAASKGGGNEVSMEQLLFWQPEVIIFAPDSVYEEVTAGDPLWKDLKAVQTGNIYEVPEGPYNWLGFPPSVNRVLGMKWLGNLIYPNLYTYDMIKETKEFYRMFYHYDLTDEEAGELLSRSTLK
ncbi:hypothetical protein AMS60_22515 [Bacillus sp. FJAT-21945]|nr:hypothetical protein AMS60_22515 [Bacillus sp. FJAT-21945]